MKYCSIVRELLHTLTHLFLIKVCNGYGLFYDYDLAKNKRIEHVYYEITGCGLTLHAFLAVMMGGDEHRGLVKAL